ncbi:MAG: MFS transporter [Rickettsiaceae bacterium]|nr:MFS transporter [Rickettsiaceae bacterium]
MQPEMLAIKSIKNRTKFQQSEDQAEANQLAVLYSDQINSLSGNKPMIIFANTLGYFNGYAALSLFGPTVAIAKQLSPLEKGVLLASPSMTGALLRLVVGNQTDSKGGKKVFISLVVLENLGLITMSVLAKTSTLENLTIQDPMYWAWLGGGMLTGCGIATYCVGSANICYWFPKRYAGTSQALYAGIGNSAPAFLSFLLPLAIDKIGLFPSYATWAGVLIASSITSILLFRNSYYHQLRNHKRPVNYEDSEKIASILGQDRFPKQQLTVRETIKYLFTKENLIFVELYSTVAGGFIALIQWLPHYYNKYHKASTTYAGIITAACVLLAAFVRPFAGILSDKIGGGMVTMLSMISIICSGILLTSAQSAYSFLDIAGLVTMALGAGAGKAGICKWMATLADDKVGKLEGFVSGLGTISGAVLPPLLGLIANSGKDGYRYGMLSFSGLASISLAFNIYLLCITRRHYQQNVGLTIPADPAATEPPVHDQAIVPTVPTQSSFVNRLTTFFYNRPTASNFDAPHTQDHACQIPIPGH